jgi:hypothetical protein
MKLYIKIILLFIVNSGIIFSEELPAISEDVEPIIGYWNTDRGENYYWLFSPDHTASSGRKETDIGWIGTWTLSEYIGEPLFRLSFADEKIYNLTIFTIPTEFTIGESRTFVIIVHIINNNRIYFQFEDGNGEFLDRNNNIL